jgi:hypothetical protein
MGVICTIPPAGWHCTRTPGHDGPCAARPTETAAADLWQTIEQQQAKDEADMPDALAALNTMQRGYHRLGQLGWRGGVYCPKDGSGFAVMQLGSTGIFAGAYVDEWPTGDIWIADESTNPHACLWKAIDKLTDAERALMDACVKEHAAYIDRLGQFRRIDAEQAHMAGQVGAGDRVAIERAGRFADDRRGRVHGGPLTHQQGRRAWQSVHSGC